MLGEQVQFPRLLRNRAELVRIKRLVEAHMRFNARCTHHTPLFRVIGEHEQETLFALIGRIAGKAFD